MLKAGNQKVKMWKAARKAAVIMMGICLLTGSLCACGDDSNTVISLEELAGTVTDKSGDGAAVETAEGEITGEGAQGQGTNAEGNEEETTEVSQNSAQTQETTAEEASKTQSGNDTTEETVEEAPQEISITISAAGDVTLGNYPEQGYYLSLPYTYEEVQNDRYFFENVYDIFSEDDMTLVNLEGVFTTSDNRREGQTYSLSGKPEYANALTAGSIETVSMANNHRLDYHEEGTKDTVAVLKQEGIAYAYDDIVGIYKTKGISIGFVSVNEVGQGYAVEKYLEQGIASLQEDGVDLIIACCHWGVEREYFPENYQQSLGKKCIDWGADLVIGHHPHVLQGIEEYNGKFIVYSLGNFCFGANKNPADKDCMIFQQTFTFADGVKQEDKDIRVIPCSISSVKERNDFKPTPAVGDEAKRILDRINEFSAGFGLTFDSEGRLEE